MQDYSADYARYYHLLTGHKKYADESKLLLRFLENSGFGEFSSVLSVGCGIGSHERLLAKYVGSVLGIDQSPYMIEYGSQMDNPSNLVLKNTDLTSINNLHFDIVISLFNVVNCVSPGSSLDGFMKSIADRINPGGLVLLELWNRKATISEPPIKVNRKYSSKGVSLSRTAIPHLDPVSATLSLEYTIDGFDNDLPVSIRSTHDLYLHSIEVVEKQFLDLGFTSIKWYSALSDGMKPLVDDRSERMLLVTALKAL